MTYTVRLRKQALKELEQLPKATLAKVAEAIDGLASNPRPHGSKKLKGMDEYLWRIRVGEHRVIYAI